MDNNLIENLLSSKGVRPTANRILVLKELLKVSHPVSLSDLESSLEFSLDKSSVFRVLEIFAEKDVVHVIEDGSRSLKYELCHSSEEHSLDDEHPHFYCEKCKEIFCLDDVKIPPIALPDGYKAHSVNYVIKGLCPNCS